MDTTLDATAIPLANPWTGVVLFTDYSELTQKRLDDMAVTFDPEVSERLHGELAGDVTPGEWLAAYVEAVGCEQAGAEIIGA